MNDEYFLKKAIEMATANVLAGGGPFGAVIVRDGIIIGSGANQVTPSNDPTAHAEIVAIRNACQTMGDFRLHGSVLYTSCEPCPMCLGAIYWAHISRIVFGASKVDAANAGFDDSFIYEQFELEPNQRSIETTCMDLPESGQPFETWKKLESKIEY